MLVAALTSCNNNDFVSETDGTTQQVILQVTPDQGLNSRAAATGVDRFAIEVYSDAAYTTAANVFEGGKNATISSNGTFTMTLDKNQEYHCLLWADKAGAEVYDLASLKAVTLKSGQTPEEAWQGKLDIAKGTNGTLSATLTRSVAKITLLETGKLDAGTLTMAFKQNTVFDVSAGTTKTEGNRSESINIAAITAAVPAGSKLNASDIFVLASTTDAEQPTITFQITGETDKIEVSNVPLKANYNTNIKGHYSKKADASTTTFTVTCDDAWAGNKEGTVTEPTKYAVGDLYPSADNAVGVVYYTSSDGTYGYVVSMDETVVNTWGDGQTWATSKQDGGFTWRCPTKDELQYLWCVYNGASLVTWTGKTDPCPAANAEKQAEFNAKLTTALSTIDFYWTSTEDVDKAWSVRFSSGMTNTNSKTTKPTSVRAITIFGSAPL